MPQAITSWLRSFGVIQANPQSQYELTERGREWASRITWSPEPLQAPEEPVEPPIQPPATNGKVELPALSLITTQLQSAGYFPSDLVARLHAGLWSHPRRHFAILTGLSGAGKTLLAREYGVALTKGGGEVRCFTLPVQPGWYDPGALLGYANPLRRDSYVRTNFLEFLLAAAGDSKRPYVVVLDEMNLSHPEQYMAPLLSAMETGEAIQPPGSMPSPRTHCTPERGDAAGGRCAGASNPTLGMSA